MIKIEIIGNVELLEEFEHAVNTQFPNQYYTIVPVLKGYGKKGFASGDSVWPESNFYCFMYVEEVLIDDLKAIKQISDNIQRLSPQNAITFFSSRVDTIPI